MTNVRGNLNAFYAQELFSSFENFIVCEITVQMYCRARQATDDITAHACSMLDT